MNENTERWLSYAREDLRAAQAVLREGLPNQACFHAQQCVEKCLKSALARADIAPPKTHSIQELASRLPSMLSSISVEILAELDDYYIPTRYPDALPGALPEGLPSKTDAERAVALADQVMVEVERRLSDCSPAL